MRAKLAVKTVCAKLTVKTHHFSDVLGEVETSDVATERLLLTLRHIAQLLHKRRALLETRVELGERGLVRPRVCNTRPKPALLLFLVY